MANICQCGCGESLPENSTRQYKRGHKARLDNPAEGFQETPVGQDGEPQEFVPLSIDEVAQQTPDDPEPKEQPEVRTRATLKVTAALRRDVEGKLAFCLALSGQMWSLADPICGGAYLEQSPEIARKLTPIVCQSPEVVKWLTKSGNFVLWLDLFMACWPVVQIVFAHHIAKSLAVDVASNGQRPAPNDYVVQ